MGEGVMASDYMLHRVAELDRLALAAREANRMEESRQMFESANALLTMVWALDRCAGRARARKT